MATARDIPLIITSPSSSSERRITPSWTIAHLKQKLEPVTGIPPSAQKLTLRLPDQQEVAIEAEDEDAVQVGRWDLIAYAEIKVTSADPLSTPQIPAASTVPKYIMPIETYSALPSTVLAYKKSHQIGRFDPSAPEIQERKIQDMWREIKERGISPPSRCRLSPTRRGSIRYVGPVPQLPGLGPWIGIQLDEPVGKNDGSVAGMRYFECEPNTGVFVRAAKVEVGEWGVLGVGEDGEDGDEGEDMEEI